MLIKWRFVNGFELHVCGVRALAGVCPLVTLSLSDPLPVTVRLYLVCPPSLFLLVLPLSRFLPPATFHLYRLSAYIYDELLLFATRPNDVTAHSVTLTAAWLMGRKGMSFDDAFELLVGHSTT